MNVVLMIGDMPEGENVHCFVDGLQYNVRVEIMKSNYNSFENCPRLALNLDSVFWRALRRNSSFNFNSTNAPSNRYNPTVMEIGNINGNHFTKRQGEQRKNDIELRTYFKYDKLRFRLWKCRQPKVNNLELVNEPLVPGDAIVQFSDLFNQ